MAVMIDNGGALYFLVVERKFIRMICWGSLREILFQ